jgi:hypothetical protein
MFRIVLTMLLSVASSNPVHVNFTAFGFIHLGTFETSSLIINDSWILRSFKSFYLSKHLALSWRNAYNTCKNIGMDMVTLNTTKEAEDFLKLCKDKEKEFDSVCPKDLPHPVASIGGIKCDSSWSWLATDQIIDFPLSWAPGEPSNQSGEDFCLGVIAKDGKVGFTDIDCYKGFFPFICQLVNKKF